MNCHWINMSGFEDVKYNKDDRPGFRVPTVIPFAIQAPG